MTEPLATPAQRSPIMRFIRRATGAVIIGTVFFAVLWMTVFNAMNAALVSSGTAVILVTASSISDGFQSIFDTVAEFVLGIFGAIADFFASIFD